MPKPIYPEKPEPTNLQRKAALRLNNLYDQMGASPWNRMSEDPVYKQNFLDNFGGAIAPESVKYRDPSKSVEPPMNRIHAAIEIAKDTIARRKGQKLP